jgi:sugar phosphate isomerase/epimerase
MQASARRAENGRAALAGTGREAYATGKREHNESMTSRRSFLRAAALLPLASRAIAKELTAIGVQLYTVRDVLPKKPAETLRAIESIGYREVEATAGGLDRIWPALEATRLKPVSCHLDSKMVTQGPGDELSRTLDGLKKRGFSYAVFPYLPPDERGGLDVIKALAEKLNRAGEKARAAGLKFCYHNHAFEFQPMDGSMPAHVLFQGLDPELVNIELDVFWVSVSGNDPVEMLNHLTGRVPLVHLKDKASGTEVQYNESVPRTTFKEVGSGVLDWPRVLQAADTAGVEHYFVEQDQTPGDPVDSLRQSFNYLKKLSF